MTPSAFLSLLLAGATLATGTRAEPLARLNEYVAVSASAAADYQRPTDARGELLPQSYVLAEGHFLAGTSVDRGLQRTRLADLAPMLGENLLRQRYVPAADLASADLLIVVHFGSTESFEDPQRDATIDRLNAQTTLANEGSSAADFADPDVFADVADQSQAGRASLAATVSRNAALLGYQRTLARHGSAWSAEARTLHAELAEERYFIVLMAYDRRGVPAGQRPPLIWTTRLSVRSPGNNFREAAPVLGQAGSHVFGRNLDELVHVKANLRQGQVEIGELQVIEEPPPSGR